MYGYFLSLRQKAQEDQARQAQLDALKANVNQIVSSLPSPPATTPVATTPAPSGSTTGGSGNTLAQSVLQPPQYWFAPQTSSPSRKSSMITTTDRSV
jgi:hypothetical protein